jgi:hypothetical protein
VSDRGTAITLEITDRNAAIAAQIAIEATARTAEITTAVQQEVDGRVAAVQTQATVTDGLSAQYTVKVDVNGYVSGYGLASTAVDGVPTSTMTFLVDRFFIASPGDTSLSFAVVGGKVMMDAAFITNLTADKITAGTISAAVSVTALTFNGGSINIGSGKFTVDTAGNVIAKGITIQTAAGVEIMSSGNGMDGAYISNATIGRLSIGANQIILPVRSFTAANYGTSSAWVLLETVVLTLDEAKDIYFMFGMQNPGSYGSGELTGAQLRIDGVEKYERTGGNVFAGGVHNFVHAEALGTGTFTCTLWGKATGGGTTGMKNRYITAQVFYR